MNSFALSSTVTNRYIALKYSAATRDDWEGVVRQAGRAIELTKREKEAVYTDGPKVHGARQQSQLDLLDQREVRMSAVYDNALEMMSRSK